MGSEDVRDTKFNLSLIKQNTNLNWSGLSQITTPTTEISTQTDKVKIDKLKIHINQNCTNEIKSVCAQVSSACGISIEMTRTEVKTICKALYEHVFFNNEEANKKIELAAKRKPLISKQGYKNYESVQPSAQTVADDKHLEASEVECDAAIALIYKNKYVKVILHYDAKSRHSINDEWPSSILNFSQKFCLRPLFCL